VKGHDLGSEEAATRAVQLCACLPRGSFPKVLGQHGSALVSEWIAGESLAQRRITSDQRQRLAAVLGEVHAASLPADFPEATDEYPGGRWQDELKEKLERLRATGRIAADDGARALELTVAHAPPRRRVTLVHGDLCPENVVVDVAGGLWVIDIDQIDLHVPEFDLARCWYRWPMTPDDRAVFEAGYGEAEVVASYRAHFFHWAVVVLVGAMAFRSRYGIDGVEPLARRLREVLSWRGEDGKSACR